MTSIANLNTKHPILLGWLFRSEYWRYELESGLK